MSLTLATLTEALQKWDGCALAANANPVLGDGNPNAEVFFIGEAPGKKEDELKKPFVGAAGKLLNELLASINLQREDVYISNTVKYRPPDNRDPTPQEKEQCMPWLQLELAIIKPKAIVTLGRHSLGHFLQGVSMTEAHGKPFKLNQDVSVFPMYHPAAAMYNGGLRETLFKDFLALKEFLALANN